MAAPYEPPAGDPPDRLRKVTDQHGSSALPTGYDAASGTTAGYPSGPVRYPGTPGQFDPAGQSTGSAGSPYDPAGYSPPPYSPPPYSPPPYSPSGYSQSGYSQSGYRPPPYGQSPYAAPGYPGPISPFGAASRNGMGTAGLVLGIIGIVLSWTPIGFILGILAIIFGSIGRGRATRGEATNHSSATAGLVLGIVAIALLVVLLVVGLGAWEGTTRISS